VFCSISSHSIPFRISRRGTTRKSMHLRSSYRVHS
jgi:hypothetical protein